MYWVLATHSEIGRSLSLLIIIMSKRNVFIIEFFIKTKFHPRHSLTNILLVYFYYESNFFVTVCNYKYCFVFLTNLCYFEEFNKEPFLSCLFHFSTSLKTTDFFWERERERERESRQYRQYRQYLVKIE